MSSSLHDAIGLISGGAFVTGLGVIAPWVFPVQAAAWERLRRSNRFVRWYFRLFFGNSTYPPAGMVRSNRVIALILSLIGLALILVGINKLYHL